MLASFLTLNNAISLFFFFLFTWFLFLSYKICNKEKKFFFVFFSFFVAFLFTFFFPILKPLFPLWFLKYWLIYYLLFPFVFTLIIGLQISKIYGLPYCVLILRTRDLQHPRTGAAQLNWENLLALVSDNVNKLSEKSLVDQPKKIYAYIYGWFIWLTLIAQFASKFSFICFLLLYYGQSEWLAFMAVFFSLVLLGVYLLSLHPVWKNLFGFYWGNRALGLLGFDSFENVISLPFALFLVGLFSHIA